MFVLNPVVLIVCALLLASSCLACDRTLLATRLESGSEHDKYASHAAVVVFAVFATCILVAIPIAAVVLLRRRRVSTNQPASKRVSAATYSPSALTTMTEFRPSRRPSEETFVVGSLEGFHSYLSGKDLEKGSVRSVTSSTKANRIPMSSSWESDSTLFIDVDLEKLSFVADTGHFSQANSSDPSSNRAASCYSVASTFPRTPNSFLDVPATPQASPRADATARKLPLPANTNDALPDLPPRARLPLTGSSRSSPAHFIFELPPL